MSNTTIRIRTTRQQLTGDWQVCPVPLDLNRTAEPTASGKTYRIPACAHLQPALYPDRPYWGEHLRRLNDSAWLYRRTFAAPEGGFSRTRLRFGGVDYYAAVWLNGRFIGQHEGGFAPFIFDVTAALQPGDNRLSVTAASPWDAPNPNGAYPVDHVIRGLVKGLYEHGEGVIPPDVNPIGIWQPVELLLDDGLSLDAARIRTTLDGVVAVRLTATNARRAAWSGKLALHIAAENHDGPGVSLTLPLRLPLGTTRSDHTLRLPEPRLWWPWDQGEPHLYRLDAHLIDSDGQQGALSAVFGVRTVRLERTPRRFVYYLNAQPVAVRGSSYIPALYLSQTTPESLARDVALARDTHLNLLRVHVHVSPPALYDACDRAGMLIWQDSELNWIHDPSPAFEVRARALQHDMIAELGNHPSIITWACHNEPTMVFVRRANLERHPDPALYADALKQDPTRPVFICSGQIEDDWQRGGDSHSYYGAIWSRRYTDIYRHFCRLNTEFGFEAPAAAVTLRQYADVWARLGHLEDQIADLWAYQAELVQYHVEHFRRLRAKGCAGYVHFWLRDLVPQVGCGVLDAAGIPKRGYEALRRASQPLLPALEHDGRRAIALWVFNDTPAAYPGARLRWTVEAENGRMVAALSGEQAADIGANSAARVVWLNWPAGSASQAARVHLALWGADGAALAENHYTRPLQPRQRPSGYPWQFDRYLGCKVFDRPGAPSLADQNTNALFRLVPLALRHRIAEWALRQKLPLPLVSLIAQVGDKLMG